MPPELHFDVTKIDFTQVLADKEAIRQVNPQRFEMEHLDAIVFVEPSLKIIVGYRDVRADEFWVRGHMPGYPLLPGVLMCEAAAQLCSYYTMKYGDVRKDFIGFGGLEHVRFRGTVKPGDRLVLVCKVLKMHYRQAIFNVQAFVGATMVFHGEIIGVPLDRKAGV